MRAKEKQFGGVSQPTGTPGTRKTQQKENGKGKHAESQKAFLSFIVS
jgi:hypothetical protein